jgi:hypothetical protein
MQKWEYMFITAESAGGEWRVRWMNHAQELQNWKKGPSVATFVNQMGNDGWELVNSHMIYQPSGGFARPTFYDYLLEFKRPK